jgi:hypothetical protein
MDKGSVMRGARESLIALTSGEDGAYAWAL